MPRSIATPPLDGMLVHHRVTPQQYVAGTHLYIWVRETKWRKVPVSKVNATGEASTPDS